MGSRLVAELLSRSAFGATCVLVALAGVILADTRPAHSTDPPVMRIEPSSTKLSDIDAAPGAVFIIEIVVEDVQDLGAFEFELTTDTNFFKYGAFEVGAFFNSTGRSASCFQFVRDDGSADFGCTSDGPLPPGPGGSGVVATIELIVQGFGAGETFLVLSSCNASDVLGKEVLISACKSAKLDLNLPTPTPFAPERPRMQKLPELQNVFLTRQGSKVPPDSCLEGTDIGRLEERLSRKIPFVADPKDPKLAQQLGAFEFEVHYDNKKVCVQLVPGPAAQQMTCFVEDSATTPQLEGVARIGCVTIGKSNFPNTSIEEGRFLAQVLVRPQPEIYSQAKPGQDNGVVVQINNVKCSLSDLQGHAIAVAACDDADITFRFLEGDVQPDCTVDAADAQAIAFRWGSQKGGSIYKDFMNLEPAEAQQDGDIDINDLQFVYGRFGSTCDDPHPLQKPVNPKGGPDRTPTATPGPTPTPVEAKPRVNISPDFQKLLLTSPPPSGLCKDSPDPVTFDIIVKDPITTEDPKDPSLLQSLGAFEFEVQYDDAFLCLEIEPGPIPQGQMNCLAVQTEGIIRYGCTTILGAGPAAPQPPGVLAKITVRVESDVYVIATLPGKLVFDLVTKNCKLSDALGHRIKSTDCSGAIISVHYP